MDNLKTLKLQRKFKSFFYHISALEDFLIGNNEKEYLQLDKKCIFVSGMPRSGTTILTHILSNFIDVGSYNYSDLPFIKLPFFWSKFKKFYYSKNIEFERFHKDGLKINLNSPDAFEELIWAENIKNYYSENFSKILGNDFNNEMLEKELKRNINKLLIVRKKKIYLSKGNYNIFRINYIRRIIKNSYFIICLRNPADVIQSSVRTHNLFLELDKKNKNFSNEMEELCHFEFGKKRKNIFKEIKNIDNFSYYHDYWFKIHQMILDNYINLDNVFLVSFDNLLSEPKKSLSALSDKIGINSQQDLSKMFKKNKEMITNNNLINNSKVSEIYKNLIDRCINNF